MKVTALCLSRGDQAMLDAAFACWQTQTFPGLEFLVVHDGTRPLICPGREVIGIQSENLGARRNRGIAAATGDVIAVWDDDDWSAPERLAVQLQPLMRGHGSSTLRDVLLDDGERRAVGVMGAGWPQTLVAFKRAIVSLAGYPETELFDGDTELMMDLQGIHNGVCLTDVGLLYHYHQHAANVTSAGHWRDIWARSVPLTESQQVRQR